MKILRIKKAKGQEINFKQLADEIFKLFKIDDTGVEFLVEEGINFSLKDQKAIENVIAKHNPQNIKPVSIDIINFYSCLKPEELMQLADNDAVEKIIKSTSNGGYTTLSLTVENAKFLFKLLQYLGISEESLLNINNLLMDKGICFNLEEIKPVETVKEEILNPNEDPIEEDEEVIEEQ